MTTSTLPSSRVWLRRFIVLLVGLFWGGAFRMQAAHETFWPFNLFPPPFSTLAYTDAAITTVTVPGVGTITTRNIQLSDFTGSITLPGLSNSAVYNNASTRFDSETSLDGGTTWAPYLGFGPASLTLRHTNADAGVRRFEMELSSQSIPVNGAFGAAAVRESPTLASLGELVVTTTNAGYFYRGHVHFFLEVSVDNGATWYAFSPAAYVELSGIGGTPARLSIARSNSTVMICWPTETTGRYQLQSVGALGDTNWTNVGSSQPGTGSEMCVVETPGAAIGRFYRLSLSP